MQINIYEIIYLNCEESYEFMIDHRSYTHNLLARLTKIVNVCSGGFRYAIHDSCDIGFSREI